MAVLSMDATKAFLDGLDRWSVSDREFGGGAIEVGWTNDKGENVALGWFSPSEAFVGVDQSSSLYPEFQFDFNGDDAYALRYCGKSSRHTENSAPLPPLPEEATEADDPAGVDEALGESAADRPAPQAAMETPVTVPAVVDAAAVDDATPSVSDVPGDVKAPVPPDYLVIGIVDDDAALASTFACRAPALFDAQHVVLQATTIDTAATLLEAAAPETVDVILVDGYIPHYPDDGLVVMDRLRAAGYTGPMVAISSDDRIRVQMVRAGCVAECSKREPKQLEQVIRGLLDKTALRQQDGDTHVGAGADMQDPPTKEDVVEELAFLHDLMARRDNISPHRQRWQHSLDALATAFDLLTEHVWRTLSRVGPDELDVNDPLYKGEGGRELFDRLFHQYRFITQAAYDSERSNLERLGVLSSVDLAHEIRDLINRALKYEREGD